MSLFSPAAFLEQQLGDRMPDADLLHRYEAGWQQAQAPTPEAALGAAYEAGAVWRAYKLETALPSLTLGYVTAFFEPEQQRRQAHALAAMNLIDKYAPAVLRSEVLHHLNAQSATPMEAAVWLSEPNAVDVTAYQSERGWRLLGERVGCPNPDAHLWLVSARPEGFGRSALFAVRREWWHGGAFEDTPAVMLGEPAQGHEQINEAENVLRAAETVGGVAIVQRTLTELARARVATDPGDLLQLLVPTFALAWEMADLLNWTWREIPGFYSDTYRLYWLMTHLASMKLASTALFVQATAGQISARSAALETWSERLGAVGGWALDDTARISEGVALLADTLPLLLGYLGPYLNDGEAERLREELPARISALGTYGEARTFLQQVSANMADAAVLKLRLASVISLL